jgi:hypothetical protein
VGSSQVKDHDYTETHSPVVKTKIIRILLALSAVLGLTIEQLDVDTAFLYGNLTETNYMRLPQGFEEYGPDGVPRVAKLVKSLYGLHQAGREWYKVLKAHFLSEGFTQLKSDACTFLKIDKSTGKLIIVLIYVDDILIASADRNAIQTTKDAIKSQFSIKELGEAQWIIKIQVQDCGDAIWQGQINYITSILKEYDQWDIKEESWKDTPMAVTWKHEPKSTSLSGEDKKAYASLVAKLIYLSTHTRPDISYAVNTLAQYQQDPRDHDWTALMRILKYLRYTVDLGIAYFKSKAMEGVIYAADSESLETMTPIEVPEEMQPRGATDASHGMEDDRKSRSGYIFMMFGAPVIWFSKKQPTVALSSCEAELIALVEGVKEGVWQRDFFKELGFKLDKPTVMDQDNQSVIAIAVNPVHHARIKHMELKNCYIRENVEQGVIRLVYCPTELMIADIMTKALPGPQHWKLVELMGMRRLSELNKDQKAQSHLVTKYY